MLTAEVIREFGSAAALAAALEITPQAISQWGRTVPRSRQFQIQVLTGGRLRAGGARARPGGSAR